MDDLAAWLTQIFDEDVAASTLIRPQTTFSPSDAWIGPHLRDCFALIPDTNGDLTGNCDCGEPQRRLARIAADRQILGLAEEASFLDRCLPGHDEGPYVGDRILRAIASAYADRPGYRQEWKL